MYTIVVCAFLASPRVFCICNFTPSQHAKVICMLCVDAKYSYNDVTNFWFYVVF